MPAQTGLESVAEGKPEVRPMVNVGVIYQTQCVKLHAELAWSMTLSHVLSLYQGSRSRFQNFSKGKAVI